MVKIELDGDVVKTLDYDTVDEIYANSHITRSRVTNIIWSNKDQCWCVKDVATKKIVANGFLMREDALTWEKENYNVGCKYWDHITNKHFV